MSWHDYWHGDPAMLTDYCKAFIESERARMRDMDLNAWLQGQYACLAHGVVLGNAFAKKNSQKQSYPEEPLYGDLWVTEKQRKANEERRKTRELEKQFANFKTMAARMQGTR